MSVRKLDNYMDKQNPYGGLLTPEEQNQFLILYMETKSITGVVKTMRKSIHTFYNTKSAYPDFAADIQRCKATWVDTVERTLLARALGECSEQREVWVTKRDPQTQQPLFDRDGEPDLYLAKRELRRGLPDVHAGLILLRAWAPDLYGKTEKIDLTVEPREEPEAVRARLGELLAAKLKGQDSTKV